jgi:hypothetical protein
MKNTTSESDTTLRRVLIVVRKKNAGLQMAEDRFLRLPCRGRPSVPQIRRKQSMK